MKEEPEVWLRPKDFLNTLLAYSGHNRPTFAEGSQASVYALFVSTENIDNGMPSPRWVSVGIAGGVNEALTDGYEQVISFFRDDYANKKPDEVRALLALGVVAYGEGRVVANPNRETPLSADEIEDDESRVLYELTERGGWARTRTVTVISPEGFANHTTMLWEGHPEPFIDISEMWISEDNPDGLPDEETLRAVMSGELMNALTAAFTLLMLINESVASGHEPGIAGLIEVTKKFPEHGAASQLRGLIRQFVQERDDLAREVLEENERLRRRFDGSSD